MTGIDLYDQFREALDYLGVGFHGMEGVKIFMAHNGITIETDSKACIIKIPSGESK